MQSTSKYLNFILSKVTFEDLLTNGPFTEVLTNCYATLLSDMKKYLLLVMNFYISQYTMGEENMFGTDK
jgi:hypothetical protein